MSDQLMHFLVWGRFRMACGKKPGTVFSSTYFWSKVTCRECLKHEAFGEVVK